jgi:cytochrome P450
MLFRDPPDHTRLRALVSRAFTSSVVEGMRRHIRRVVDGLLDRVQDAGRMDVIADLAYPMPVRVICGMLGVPLGDQEAIREWSADLGRSLDAIGLTTGVEVLERGRAGQRAMSDYFRRLAAERRRRPTDDLLSHLIAAEEAGDHLTEDEVIGTCVLLLFAGHDTTMNLLGNGILALLRAPQEFERLKADPGLIGSAVEELLRYDSPVQRTGRFTRAPVEMGGRMIPEGAIVVVVIGAANRDPAQFPNPDRLDVGRADNRHIAFGYGIHYCLGAPLARVEAQIALGAVIDRLGDLALADLEPEWRESQVLRGLKALPVTFTPQVTRRGRRARRPPA